MHRNRMKRTGTYDPGPKSLPFVDRLWMRVDRSGGPDACWPWTGPFRVSGYGYIKKDGRNHVSHRMVWELTNGPIPDGLVIDHMCHVKACHNPKHLQVVTRQQNTENFSGPSIVNRTGVRGVSWSPVHKCWRARVVHNGQLHQRLFDTLEEAAVEVVKMRNELHTNNLKDRAA